MRPENTLYRSLSIAIVLCLYSYVILKAWLVPITYDEAYTIDIYAQMPFADIMFSERAFNVANNHILNTILTRIVLTFSGNPFLLRLPALLAYGVYLYSGHHISRLWFQNRLLAFLSFLCLSLNPMLSEFFALCRGYAPGLAFMMFALLQLVLLARSEKKRSPKHAWLCGLAVILSTYSTVSFLVPSLCILAVMVLLRYQNFNGSVFAKRIIYAASIPSFTVLSIAGLIYLPVKHMLASKALFHGGNNNFITDTWMTMVSDLTGGRPRSFAAFDAGNYSSDYLTFYTVVSMLIVIIATVIIVYHFIKKGLREYQLEAIPLLIIWGAILAINAQFYLTGTLFITYRVALYFYPMLVLLLFAAIRIFQSRQPKLSLPIASIFTLLLSINFLAQLKIRYATEWPFDAYNKDVCEVIAAQTRQDKGARQTLYAHEIMVPSINFYVKRQYRDVMQPATFNSALLDTQSSHYNYIYLPKIFATKIPSGFRIVKSYEDSTYLLYRRF